VRIVKDMAKEPNMCKSMRTMGNGDRSCLMRALLNRVMVKKAAMWYPQLATS